MMPTASRDLLHVLFFDLFFNSFNGYRGWYFRSPAEGLKVNAQLLRLLAPRLTELHTDEDMPMSLASMSLLASSAKCWLAEVGRGRCPKCEGDWSIPIDDSPDILNGRWTSHRGHMRALDGKRPTWKS
jgi:hypothetical protein